ncbi:ribokinase [Virgibacillus halotolerans]|uniref:ribokinase n=1 Tax=Virgibacillus halotolerans TaxID=1071053 RepID=UPI00195F85B5|nr:ribokinase [Virgibacillus halotolerans]MBM7599080.1 ribokinase [Virgibacillus halotolerans]
MVAKKQKKILSIGSYNVGLTCRTGRIPAWGETLIGSDFSEGYGGKGANQAVSAAKLGGDVTFVGSLGSDKYGDDGLTMMAEAGINTSHIIRMDNVSTGVGIILLNDDNDNCIIVDLGANNKLAPAHLEALEHVIADSDIVVFQLETPIETVKCGMGIAKRLGKLVILNPAPANIEAVELLSLATIINPNESELLLLNGQHPNANITEQECVQLARNLLEKGPEVVIVTRGEKGSLIVTADETRNIQSVKVDVVDTTGAGDAFTGALAVALSEEKSILDAVQFASLTGAYCVTKEEVIPGLPTKDQLNQFQQTNYCTSGG